MIRVLNLKKKFSDFDLNVPEMELSNQQITALLGPSGSGKTTLFRILMGIEDCDQGQCLVGDVDLLKKDIENRNLGVLTQSYDLFPHMSALENIDFARQARKLKGSALQSHPGLIETLGLKDILQRKAAVLSGGEQQRVALARALVGEPSLLLLDEPFSALDEDNKNRARQLLREVFAMASIPTLLITHDIRDVEILQAKVYHLKMGHLVP